MVENPGRLVTHDELLDALWPDTFVQPQVLRTYMLELRKVLGDDAGQPRFIQTQPKRGYRFVAAVTEKTEAPHATLPHRPSPAERDIVGRDQELARLKAELEAACRGKRRFVLVIGEAGIGKTALIDALALNPAAGVLPVRGQCVPGVGEESFYPITEALEHLCASPEGEVACQALARLAPAWLAPLGSEPARAAAHPYCRAPGRAVRWARSARGPRNGHALRSRRQPAAGRAGAAHGGAICGRTPFLCGAADLLERACASRRIAPMQPRKPWRFAMH